MGVEKKFSSCSYQPSSVTLSVTMVGGSQKPTWELKDMEEKHLHNLFLKNMSGLIEEVKNPTPRLNPNSKCGGMATHAGLAIELGITRKVPQPPDGGDLDLVPVQDEGVRQRQHLRLHPVLVQRPRLLRSHPQLLPQRL